jgi:hypothetical protein
MNDFADDLAYSHASEDLPCWLEIYKQAFPTMSGMISHRKDGEHQRAGIDRSIILESGKQITVDEKIRRKNYGDIALEYIANDRTNAPGWVCKSLLCDYIAYAVQTTGKAYLLPVPQMQAAWAANSEKWKKLYFNPKAPNRGYKTISVAVPIDVLFAAIGKCLRVDFTPIQEDEEKPKEQACEYAQAQMEIF